MKTSLSAFLQWKINIFLYQKLGWNLAFWYIQILGNLYFLLKRKEKQKIKLAVDMVFKNNKKPLEKKMLISQVFRGILQHYYEKLFNVYSSLEGLTLFFNKNINPEGLTFIEQDLNKGKGVLLVTGHFGGIEFIPKYLATRKFPVTIVAKFSSHHLCRISEEQAQKLSIHLINADFCTNIIKAILQDLKENRVVITQCDEIEKWRPEMDKEISFLGRRIYLDKTFNTLIKRAETSVVFAVMHRSSNQKYHFIVHHKKERHSSPWPIGSVSRGEELLKLLEYYIYLFPEEWYQWKKVPTIKTAGNQAWSGKSDDSLSWLEPAHEISL
jgi:lauroyl/myristoyl acyltransferase